MARKCPACGGLEHTIIKRLQMVLPKGISLPEEYNIVACRQCGCCYADTPAAQADYDDYYANYNNYSGKKDNKLFERTFSPIASFVTANLSPSAHILDIGFGKGELLLRLRELGYSELTGLDPSQHSVNRLSEHGIRAYQKSVYDAPGELENCFDLVLLTSVVEHLLEPKTAIDCACAYLKDGGYLIIDVPDYAMCDQVDLPVPNQFNQEHINYFSEDSFAEMLRGTPCRLLSVQPVQLRDEASQSSEYSKIFMMQKCEPASTQAELPASSPTGQYLYTVPQDSLKQGACDGPVSRRDVQTEAAIRRYLSRQESRKNKMAEVIAGLYTSQIPLVVWGTGAMTMSLLASTRLPECNIIAFADGNPLKAGTCFYGKEIISPEHIRHYPDAAIMISVMKSTTEIKEEIASLKLQNAIIELL